MENKQNTHQGGGGGNSFLFGFVVGAAITLLFTTKKGRELVRTLTEKGIEKFSELENELQKTENDYEEFDDEDDYVEPEPRKKLLAEEVNQEPQTAEQPEPKKEHPVHHVAEKAPEKKEEPVEHHTSKITLSRRLFKRVAKKN